MGFIDAFVLVGLFFVGLPLAALLGWVMRAVFRTRRFSAVPALLVLATIVAGAPLALRVAGVQTDARVVDRDERVQVDPRDGSWASTPRLHVRFRPPDARRADPLSRSFAPGSVDAGVAVNADEFDRTPIGAMVPVTYVSFRPSIAKLSDRTVRDFWRDILSVGGMSVAVTLLVALVAGLIVWTWQPEAAALRRLRRGALALAVGVVGIAGTRVALSSAAHGTDEPTPATASARVEGISTISSCRRCGMTSRSARLLQPFQVVTLAFTPQGARFPVRTADAVDSGSVRGLVDFAVLPVHYAPDHPRAVRIDGAVRTFEVKNGRDTLLITMAFWGVVALGYVAFSYAWPRMRARVAS
ncbi:MAG TPA: hypothetical protein VGD56_09595 [Gemmatirosa sp.]